MTGGRTGAEMKKFWLHAMQHTEWKDHPVLNDPKNDLESSLVKHNPNFFDVFQVCMIPSCCLKIRSSAGCFSRGRSRVLQQRICCLVDELYSCKS